MAAPFHRREPQPYRVRPMTPADLELDRVFISHLSPRSRYLRFMHAMSDPAQELLRGLMALDGHRNAAFVATVGHAAAESIIGVARYAAEDATTCEFAVAVADDWQCRGIASALMARLFEHATREGYRLIFGNILADNAAMIELAQHLGLEIEPLRAGETLVRAVRRLAPSAH
jgi:acetyltransferase